MLANHVDFRRSVRRRVCASCSRHIRQVNARQQKHSSIPPCKAARSLSIEGGIDTDLSVPAAHHPWRMLSRPRLIRLVGIVVEAQRSQRRAREPGTLPAPKGSAFASTGGRDSVTKEYLLRLVTYHSPSGPCRVANGVLRDSTTWKLVESTTEPLEHLC
jgi:hypothetical protein